jgi:hypothetical protein
MIEIFAVILGVALSAYFLVVKAFPMGGIAEGGG